MNPSEKMGQRALFYDRLVYLDAELKIAFGREPSNRTTALARDLLNERVRVCEALVQAGFQPWDLEGLDEIEDKAFA